MILMLAIQTDWGSPAGDLLQSCRFWTSSRTMARTQTRLIKTSPGVFWRAGAPALFLPELHAGRWFVRVNSAAKQRLARQLGHGDMTAGEGRPWLLEYPHLCHAAAP